jgi:cell division protein FtsI/penicillin-binding protein 2
MSANKRVNYFLFFVIAIGLGLGFRLFQKQILESDRYLALAKQQHQTVQELPAHRGKIYALTQYGGEVVLATNQTYYSLMVVPSQISDKDQASLILSQKTTLSKDEIYKKIDNNKPYLPPILEKLSYKKAQSIAKEELRGVYLIAEDYRYYPNDKLACYATGYLNSDQDGQYGVEQYYNEILEGNLGIIKAHKDVYGRYISIYEKEDPNDGQDIVLSLDMTVQAKADEVISEAVEKYGARSGSIAILDPKNGEILAMAHSKSYDPNNYAREAKSKGVEIFFDPTISATYEPGSIMKPIAMASALDDGVIRPETSHRFGAWVEVEGTKIWNSAREAYGEETMVEVLENSDNVGMVWVQQQLGKKKLHNYLQKFGFGSVTVVDLEGEADGRLLEYPYNYRDIDAASNSFGQAISATPLQMLVSYTPFINQGKLVQPHILKKRIEQNGKEYQVKTVKSEQIISSEAAEQIVDMLVSVVDNGQANLAKIPGYRVAGKTGTAQVATSDGYSETKTIHSFMGFAPADNPVFLMLVKLDHPTAARWSSLTAAPTWSSMAKFLLNYYQVQPEKI